MANPYLVLDICINLVFVNIPETKKNKNQPMSIIKLLDKILQCESPKR